MAKLVLRESCYSGLKNVKKCTAKNKPEHENLVKEANKRIEENRIRYAAAYKNAGSYLGQ
ncbi:hypothetical protein G4960_14745 [Blautia obeum]|jgi:hypothetical protein|uniref:hypothetical protein n=1 Tax=Blautia obeum TaxID=40520 RepID=UPI00157070FB|nr:hypothetical protein [Blautia obeum]NSG41002.1 hypothetical protein [Blautia obeum]